MSSGIKRRWEHPIGSERVFSYQNNCYLINNNIVLYLINNEFTQFIIACSVFVQFN